MVESDFVAVVVEAAVAVLLAVVVVVEIEGVFECEEPEALETCFLAILTELQRFVGKYVQGVENKTRFGSDEKKKKIVCSLT